MVGEEEEHNNHLRNKWEAETTYKLCQKVEVFAKIEEITGGKAHINTRKLN